MGEFDTEERDSDLHNKMSDIPTHIVREGLFWVTVIVHESPRQTRKFRGRTKGKAMHKFWVWMLSDVRK